MSLSTRTGSAVALRLVGTEDMPINKNATASGGAVGGAAGSAEAGTGDMPINKNAAASGSAVGGAAGGAKAGTGDMPINNRAAASTVGSTVTIAGETLSFLAAAVSAQPDCSNTIGVVVLLFDRMGLRASCDSRRNVGFERAARSALSKR